MSALRLRPYQEVEAPLAAPSYLAHITSPAAPSRVAVTTAVALHVGVFLAALGVIREHALPPPPPPAASVALVIQKSPAVGTGPQVVAPTTTQVSPAQVAAPATPQTVVTTKSSPNGANFGKPSPAAAKPVLLAALPMPVPPAPPPPAMAAQHANKLPAQMRHDGDNQKAGAGLVMGAHIIPARPDDAVNQPPAYPPEALQHGEAGRVLLSIHVLPNGKPDRIIIASSSGFSILDAAARDAVMAWRFQPAVEGTRPVPSVLPFWIAFRLN